MKNSFLDLPLLLLVLLLAISSTASAKKPRDECDSSQNCVDCLSFLNDNCNWIPQIAVCYNSTKTNELAVLAAHGLPANDTGVEVWKGGGKDIGKCPALDCSLR